MTINFFVLKGELNGKIVVLRFFFFCWVYYVCIYSRETINQVFIESKLLQLIEDRL